MGSSTPIMTGVNRGDSQREPLVTNGEPTSPISHDPVIGGAGLGAASLPPPHDNKARSIAGSTATRDTEGGPFSGADAAIMAAAFRDTLRKPDFADRPLEEGESPEGKGEDDDVLERELAEEGHGLRSVNSSRVRVEGDEAEVGTVRHHLNDDAPSVDSDRR